MGVKVRLKFAALEERSYYKGLFINHVDGFLDIFDPPPPPPLGTILLNKSYVAILTSANPPPLPCPHGL